VAAAAVGKGSYEKPTEPATFTCALLGGDINDGSIVSAMKEID
jgi:hypothetical protein